MLDTLLDFLLNDMPKIAQSFLIVVGGLNIIARYTPWQWDDKFFSALEKPARALVKWFPKKPSKKKKRRAKKEVGG